MDILKLYPQPHAQTAGRLIDGEAILILSDASEINVLNAVGSRIFELATGENTVAEIVEKIVVEYEVSAETAIQDTLQFLREMQAQQVLVLIPHPNHQLQ